MKLLESSCSEILNSALNFETGRCKISGRVEIYSCKLVTNEKRLYKQLNGDPEHDPHKLEALSPPEGTNCCSSAGQGGSLAGFPCSSSPSKYYSRSLSSEEGDGSYIMRDTISRKTLFYLIATLNASFSPDYDFSKAKAEEFCRQPNHTWVMNAIDANFLSSPAHQSYSALKEQLWLAIDTGINTADCEIYSYNPDLSSDPYSEDGSLWSFNYFFYNKKLKRVLFFTCRCTSNNSLWGDVEQID